MTEQQSGKSNQSDQQSDQSSQYSGQSGQSSQYSQDPSGQAPQGGLQLEEGERTQSQFDSAFAQQMLPTTVPGFSPVDWAAVYFEQAEQTLRTARRVAELSTIHAMRQQIVQDVTRQVIATISSNPQILNHLKQQVVSQLKQR
jgi:hypothetical protein